MRNLILTVAIVFAITANVGAQTKFDPVTKTGDLGNLNAGAIIQQYTNPAVPTTYEFIDPNEVGLPDENPADVINVEKKDIFGKIIIDPESNETSE